MAAGYGCLVLDPHGDLAEGLTQQVPVHRTNHVAYLDPSDTDFPIGLNFLDDVHPDYRAVAADGVVSAMRSIWGDSWGPRMEDILRNSLEALIQAPGASLLCLPRFLNDEAYRAQILAGTTSPIVRTFFAQEFDTWSPTFRETAVSPILNKVRSFLGVPSVRNIVGQQRSTLSIKQAMDNGRIVICNLAKGEIGESKARLLGAFLIARVLVHAMERSKIPPEDRRPFFLIADELPVFATDSIARLLSEGRKMAVGVVGGVQTLAQLDEPLRTIVLSNTATHVSYRVGAQDAVRLAKEMQLGGPSALQDLVTGSAWARTPWSGDTFPLLMPEPLKPLHDGTNVKKQSRRHFGKQRSKVERSIASSLGLALE